jgi:trimeric autotransporter adhesin
VSELPQSLAPEGAKPSNPEVNDPLEPLAEIVELFKSIAETGEIAPSTPSASPVYYVDDEPFDLAALLRPPAVLQAARAEAATPVAPPQAPPPAVPPPVAPPPAAQPAPEEPAPPSLPGMTVEPTDLEAVLAAASTAMAEVDAHLAEAGAPVPTAEPPVATAPDPEPAPGEPVDEPGPTDAAGVVLAALASQRAAEGSPLYVSETTPPPPRAPSAFADLLEPVRPAPDVAPPTTPTAPRGRRLLLRVLVAAVVLALMAGTGWFLARGPLARETADPVPSTAPRTTSVPIAPRQAEYAAVITAVRAATDLSSLSSAADGATTLAQEFAGLSGATPAGTALVRAQTGALQAFGSLDALTPANVSAQFPALMSTLTTASRAVTKARAALPGDDPGTDTAPATRHVRSLLGPLALDGLTARLDTLVKKVGAATTTAGLRAAAADSFQVRVASEDTVTVLGATGTLGSRAAELQQATSAISAMKDIDGDHLADWAPISTRLKTSLGALGRPIAPVQRTDQMIDAATLLIKAWEKLHAGPDAATLTAYSDRVTKAMRSWTTAWSGLPKVTVDQPTSFDLTTRFYKTSRALSSATTALSKIVIPDDAPAALVSAHRDLVALASRGRATALAGHAMALAAEDCGADCTMGPGKEWTAFARARTKVGDPAAAKAAWQSAYAAAAAEAAAVPDDSEKPEV